MAHGPMTLGEAPGVHDRGDMSAESLAGNNAAEGGDVRVQWLRLRGDDRNAPLVPGTSGA